MEPVWAAAGTAPARSSAVARRGRSWGARVMRISGRSQGPGEEQRDGLELVQVAGEGRGVARRDEAAPVRVPAAPRERRARRVGGEAARELEVRDQHRLEVR